MTHRPSHARSMPGPWAGSVPVPQPMASSPFAFARTHMWPRFARQFLAAAGVSAPTYMISPHMAPSTYSKSPAGGMGVLAQERAGMAALRDAAFTRNTGLSAHAYRPEVLAPVHMPPVSRPRVRSGAGEVPYWSIPYQPRQGPPEAVVAVMGEFREKLRQAERGGSSAAQARAMRDRIISQSILRG